MPNYSFEVRTCSGSRYTFIWDTNCMHLVLRSAKCNGIVKKYQKLNACLSLSVYDDETGKEYALTTSEIKSIHYF